MMDREVIHIYIVILRWMVIAADAARCELCLCGVRIDKVMIRNRPKPRELRMGRLNARRLLDLGCATLLCLELFPCQLWTSVAIVNILPVSRGNPLPSTLHLLPSDALHSVEAMHIRRERRSARKNVGASRPDQ
jgi:hypothetical protein